MEKLYELVEEGGFDLVVVDTPPSRNALDFLDAPRRLTHFLENRIFQSLMAPDPDRAAASWAWRPRHCCGRSPRWQAPTSSTTPSPSSRPSRAWRRDSGFGPPACVSCSCSRATAFVLVASPRPDSVDEAVQFAGKLEESGMQATALVVNRVHPVRLRRRLPSGPPGRPGIPPPRQLRLALADLVDNLAGYTLASDREESTFAELVSQVAPAPVFRVPLLDADVHDLDGLEMVADLLFGQDDA